MLEILRKKVEDSESRLQQADFQLGSLRTLFHQGGLAIAEPPDDYMREHTSIEDAFDGRTGGDDEEDDEDDASDEDDDEEDDEDDASNEDDDEEGKDDRSDMQSGVGSDFIIFSDTSNLGGSNAGSVEPAAE